jgi:fructoselysine-6-P-deglycase FrlB-like protein
VEVLEADKVTRESRIVELEASLSEANEVLASLQQQVSDRAPSAVWVVGRGGYPLRPMRVVLDHSWTS